MPIYLGKTASTSEQILFLLGLGQVPTAVLEEVGLEQSDYVGDSNSIGLLGLINPTTAILSCSANNINGTLTQSRRVPFETLLDNILTHSEYINLMNYSCYSIVPEIKALGLILDGLFLFSGLSGGSISENSCDNWNDLDTTTSYISELSNINLKIKGQTYKLLLGNTTTITGFGLDIQPCFILSNKKILNWNNVLYSRNNYSSYYWQCLLLYFNFRGGFKETFSFSGGNVNNNGFIFVPIFNAVSPSTMTGTQSFNDIFEKNLTDLLGLIRLGIIYGYWLLEKITTNLIKIDNPQRNLPIVFINNIPNQTGDSTFKIDGLYKFWYSPGDTWIDFTSKPKTYNIGSHVSVEINGDVTYNDASLRDSSLIRHLLYVKNVNGTFTAVNSSDVINGDLFYTTYSS